MGHTVDIRRLFCLAAVLASSAAAPFQSYPWSCPPTQSGPRNVWINELRYSSSLASSRAVEVASLAGSGVEPSTLSLLVIDRYGSTAGSKNVSTCLYHAPTTLNSGGKMRFWVCDDAVTGAGRYNLDMLVASGGGGIALVQQLPGQTAPAVIQYLAAGNASWFLGTEPCRIPDAVLVDALTMPEGLSIQMISPGTVPSTPQNASDSMVDIYSMHWASNLTGTWGAWNNGAAAGQNPPFHQDFVAAVPGQMPYPAVHAALSGAIPAPTANQTATINANLPCLLAPYGLAWSACSVSCLAAGGPATGLQTRYQPVLQYPTGNGTACPPLSARSQTQSCTPTAACEQCANNARDGQESDVDCGGGYPDDFWPSGVNGANATLQQAIDILFPNAGTGVTPLMNLPSGACSRCDFGRRCTVHNDCDRARGLICMPGLQVCAPWWIANVTIFVDVNISLKGVDPSQFTAQGVRDIRNITAALANVPISYVALGQVAYSPEQAPSSSAAAANGSNSSASSGAGAGRRLRHNQHAIQSFAIARALAASGDTLVVRSLIAAQTNDAAQTTAANIIADRATASLAVQESLRSYAPLINNVQYSDPAVVTAALLGTPGSQPGGTTGVPSTTNGGGVVPVTSPGPVATTPPSSSSDGSGISGGATAGIVIGAIAGFAVLVGAAMLGAAAFKKYQEGVQERRRAEAAAAARRARGVDVGETTAAADAENAGGDLGADGKAKERASFAPKHAAKESKLATEAAAVVAARSTAAAAAAAGVAAVAAGAATAVTSDAAARPPSPATQATAAAVTEALKQASSGDHDDGDNINNESENVSTNESAVAGAAAADEGASASGHPGRSGSRSASPSMSTANAQLSAGHDAPAGTTDVAAPSPQQQDLETPPNPSEVSTSPAQDGTAAAADREHEAPQIPLPASPAAAAPEAAPDHDGRAHASSGSEHVHGNGASKSADDEADSSAA